MNRKQRRAALKQRASATISGSGAPSDAPARLFAEAVQLQEQNKFDDAARVYRRLLLLKPDQAQACNNLGCVLQAQGKLSEASSRFARALTLMPQLFDQFQSVCATLAGVLPPLGEAVRQTMANWPKRLTADQLLGSAGLDSIAGDPLLLCILQSVPVRDIMLERTLTSLRKALLAIADEAVEDGTLAFCCALAKQCFINEYVFATTPDEEAQVERRKAALARAIAAGGKVSPMQIAALAMYWPLYAVSGAQALLTMVWPPALDGILTQQLRAPSRERALGASIPRLTAIDDETSLRVQRQYEESPYPRWVHTAGQVAPTTVYRYLQDTFPTAVITSPDDADSVEMLIAGCGTGWHAIEMVQKFHDARALAIDLSLASLSYAKRSTPAPLAQRIDYAQADILKLESLERRFDVIDASGVLHHMADPMQGWRILLSLLRPRGLMHLGFYSEHGRRDLAEARSLIAERGYGASPAEIRRCRQDLLNTPQRTVARFNDFFATSECRDMLFHVQEGHVTIPALKSFLAAHGLRFLGFEFDLPALQKYRAVFANAGWSMTELDRWHALETEHPDTFSGMYQFWVQRS